MNALRHSLAALFLMLLPALALGARPTLLRAHLEHDAVPIGGTVRLIIEARGQRGAPQPDLTPLEHDFRILATAMSDSSGTGSSLAVRSTRWTIQLAPRRVGLLVVPRLRLGRLHSAPLTLRVYRTTAANFPAPRAVFLDAEVLPGPRYVQAQLTYVVRLYSRAAILDGRIGAPMPSRAVVERLGPDRRSLARRDGRIYSVITRRYAIFPQASGALRIPPATFDGDVSGAPNRFSGPIWRPGAERAVRLRSTPVSLVIHPPPTASGNGPWLPARALSLDEHIEHGIGRPQVGVPFTIVLRLHALGLSAAQLPELHLPPIPGASVYANPPEVAQTEEGGLVATTVTRRFTLMPSTAGPLTVPAQRITWWDTARDAPRVARLAPRTLALVPAERAAPPSGVLGRRPADAVAPAGRRSYAFLPGFGATGAGLLLTALLGWASRRVRRGAPPHEAAGVRAGEHGRTSAGPRGGEAQRGSSRWVARTPEPGRLRRVWSRAREDTAARRALEHACRDGAPVAACRALREIGRRRWPEAPPARVGDIASRLGDPELGRLLAELERCAYARDAGPWRGEALWRHVGRGFRARHEAPHPRRRAPAVLPPLRPGPPDA